MLITKQVSKPVIYLLILLLSLLLSSCSLFAPTKHSSTKQAIASQVLSKNWQILGRISFIKEQQNWYAKFNWTQQQESFQINFTGPLGETELQLKQSNDQVTLKTPSETITGNDLEQLLLAQTGWIFPVNSLQYWIQAKTNPAFSAQVDYNSQQQFSDIYQSGWHIQYAKRQMVTLPSGKQVELPKKIIAIGKKIKIKLIISQWKF